MIEIVLKREVPMTNPRLYPGQVIDAEQLGQAAHRKIARPVACRCEDEMPRHERGSEFDVAGSKSQQRRILAHASALHAHPDHASQEKPARTLVDQAQQQRLTRAAALADDGDAIGVDRRQRLDPVERAKVGPGLQSCR